MNRIQTRRVVAHLGNKKTQLTAMLAMFGLAIGYALFAHLERTSSHLGERSDLLLLIGNILCPPALLSIFLFDLNAYSIEACRLVDHCISECGLLRVTRKTC